MKVDYSPRASGKTTRLIEWLRADTKRIMLVHSHPEADRLKREYEDVASRIMEWREYQRRYMHGSPMHTVAIDNVDLMLRDQFRNPIDRISISDDIE